MYDSQGRPYPATQYYTRLDPNPNEWEVRLYVDGSEILPVSTAPNPATLTFDTSGQVDTATATDGGYIQYTPTAISGAANLAIALDLTDTTQYGSPFAVTAMSQNGFSSGRLSGINVDSEGIISARYTNGQAEVLGKVALGNVSNPQALLPQGNTARRAWPRTATAR